jgi:hypothetical protein
MTHKHSLVCTITIKITKLNRITYIFEYEVCQVLAEGFSCSLDISKLQFLIKKRNFCCIFATIFGHQNPGFGMDPNSDPYQDSLQMLDPDTYPDPDSMNPEPQL